MISDRLSAFKRELETARKPFPLSSLLILFEIAPSVLYPNYFSDFKLLVDWLSPIEIPEAPTSCKIPRLHHTYEIQEIARILQTKQENIYHAYKPY